MALFHWSGHRSSCLWRLYALSPDHPRRPRIVQCGTAFGSYTQKPHATEYEVSSEGHCRARRWMVYVHWARTAWFYVQGNSAGRYRRLAGGEGGGREGGGAWVAQEHMHTHWGASGDSDSHGVFDNLSWSSFVQYTKGWNWFLVYTTPRFSTREIDNATFEQNFVVVSFQSNINRCTRKKK